jgi:pimeloyl-ACP methyl ester carboxylesterase
MSLYAQQTGKQGAPSIVFMHGIGTSGWMWYPQIAALSDYHCLNIDLPGHGKSNHVEWVSFADTADQAAALIQAHATNGRAHVVGLSLGGHIALALLERHPDVLDRVIVSGVTAKPMPNRWLLKPQLWLTTSLFQQRWYVNRLAKTLAPNAQSDLIENLQAMSLDAYRRIYEEAAVYHVPPSLRTSNTPTLIAAGGRESRIILEAVDVISKLMPNGQGRLAPGLGHGWNLEAPDLFSTMIRAWINNEPLPGRLRSPGNR